MDVIRIKEEVQGILEEEDLFLVDIVVKGNEGNQKVLILVDGDSGVTIDQCGKVSRRLGNVIEEKELILSKYTLEVSSPGLDFPLSIPRQYRKNIGRVLHVELNNGDLLEGELVSVDAEKLDLELNKEVKQFAFENIKQSKVKISFK